MRTDRDREAERLTSAQTEAMHELLDIAAEVGGPAGSRIRAAVLALAKA